MTADRRPTILVVDPDRDALAGMRAVLERSFDCLTATAAEEALPLMAENFVQVVLCDDGLCLPSGAALVAEIGRRWPETARVHLRRRSQAPAEPAPGDSGFDHVLTLPCPDDQLHSETATAARLFQLTRENQRLALEMRCKAGGTGAARSGRSVALLAPDVAGFEGVLRSPGSPMGPVIDAARQIATFEVPVLIGGDPGTGKRRLARAMHDVSLRSDKPFLALDCAGLEAALVALELFGARNGSVPNGQRTKIGLLQKADRGTLYLGSVETLSSELQLALLRFLQEGAFVPVGGHDVVRTRPRLVCGTSADLAGQVGAGAFCSDLFYMLSAARLDVPPLKDRPEDIAPIADAMLSEASETHGKPVFGLDDETLAFLRAYSWPGNLRELQAEITRMLIFAQNETLGPDLLSRHILQHAPAQEEDAGIETVMCGGAMLKDRVEAIEARILRETLTRLKWNKSRAAAELGLSRVGLRSKLDRYGIARPAPQPQET